jgi:YHS domain-containing protein
LDPARLFSYHQLNVSFSFIGVSKMRRILNISVVVGLVVLLGFAAAYAADKKDDKKDPLSECKCPVSGKAVSEKQTSDLDEAKVYFCCEKCKAAFDKDNKKFVGHAHLQMVQTKQYTQKACPFTGKAVKEGKDVDVGGVKVGFCCDKCKGAAEKAESKDDKDKLVEKVFNEGFKNGFAKAEKAEAKSPAK